MTMGLTLGCADCAYRSEIKNHFVVGESKEEGLSDGICVGRKKGDMHPL